MNLVRYNPNNRLSTRTDRGLSLGFFDDLFNDFFSPSFMSTMPVTLKEKSNLKVDIYEKDNSIMVNAELPGIAKEDVSVNITGKLITIGGEKRSNEEINDKNCYRRERSYGKFERTFSLPFEANAESVKATFDNGLLKLEIPKPEEQVAKQITIN